MIGFSFHRFIIFLPYLIVILLIILLSSRLIVTFFVHFTNSVVRLKLEMQSYIAKRYLQRKAGPSLRSIK